MELLIHARLLPQYFGGDVNNHDVITWTYTSQYTALLDTANGNKSEVYADTFSFVNGADNVHCADIYGGVDYGDRVGDTAYANGTIDADYAKDTISIANSP